MAAISQKITNIIGGVSQQPDTIKVGNQLRICDNYYPDVATGLTKRPGLKGISKLANAVTDGTWFSIFRDDKEKYIIQFSKAGALKVWSADTGLEQTVNTVAPESTAYAVHTNSSDLQTLQINDYIFVLNRKVVVKQGTTASPSYSPFGFVNINTVAFDSNYKITLDSTSFTHTTPANASGTKNSVTSIRDALVTLINGATYYAEGIGNTIFIRRVDNADFSLKATGGANGSAIEAFKETVTAVAQLPREFLSNRRIKVEGSAESTADEYWVEFVPSTPGQTSGVGHWEETLAPGTITDLDEETMPHVIIREANKTFTYRQLDEASAITSLGTAGGAATVTRTGGSTTATITTASAHGLTSGSTINVTEGVAIGNYSITVLTSTTFTITTIATTALTAVNFVYTASTSVVTGIPTAISITSATSGGHVVDEQFEVTGGSGKNLRLRVTKVKDVSVSNVYTANSSSYVQRATVTSDVYMTLKNKVFKKTKTTRTEYRWFLAGKQIGTTSNTQPLVVGKTTYSINSAFQSINNKLRAGLTSVATVKGVIDQIVIQQAGQGYTASNLVQNKAGDTFTITTVNTQNLEGDDARLNFWKYRDVGDTETNPMPSFVGHPVDTISFYKNRLVFSSRQNVICSQAGDYFNFFASTVITIIDSDPIDLSASSFKPIRLKYAIPAQNGLLLFGDNAQYILTTTTEAFSPKTAEINLLSSFDQTDQAAPIDIGTSYLFLQEGDKASSIFEMGLKGTDKPDVIELTRIIPTYIPAAVYDMKVSVSAGTVALLSEQEPSYMYLYRFFQNGDNRIAGWFRWNFPGTIEFVDFDQDIMYVVIKFPNNQILNGSNYVLGTVSLITDTPSDSLFFEGQYLDVRLDLFDYKPTLTYDSVADLTHVCFKDGFEGEVDINGEPLNKEQAVLIYLDSEISGSFEEQTLQYDATKPVGEKYFLTVEGNQTTSKFAVGYKYEALAQLPAFYFTKDEQRGLKDTVNIPRVSRIKVNSYNSGPYKAIVRSEGRDDFTLQLPQVNANYYRANNIPIIRNAQSTIPVLAKGDQFEFELIADSPFPTAFTSLDWEGTYNNKGIQSL